MKKIKIVVIGSESVGKTRFLNSYVTSPSSSSAPFDTYNGIKVEIEQDGEMFQLELWDTGSADHNKMIRKIYYDECNFVLICFSVMDHETFRDVRKKWISEVKKCCSTAQYLLIGTKCDLREDKVSLLRLDRLHNLKPITKEEGAQMSERISAAKYLECSAVSGMGLKEVFREVIQLHNNPEIKSSSCSIL